VVEQFHIGQRVRLTRTLATRPEGLFRRGATGTVMYMEEMVLIRMDQHFPQLDHLDNAMWVKYSDITAELRREGSWRGSGPRCSGRRWRRNLQNPFLTPDT
jgi:hypothetical protein